VPFGEPLIVSFPGGECATSAELLRCVLQQLRRYPGIAHVLAQAECSVNTESGVQRVHAESGEMSGISRNGWKREKSVAGAKDVTGERRVCVESAEKRESGEEKEKKTVNSESAELDEKRGSGESVTRKSNVEEEEQHTENTRKMEKNAQSNQMNKKTEERREETESAESTGKVVHPVVCVVSLSSLSDATDAQPLSHCDGLVVLDESCALVVDWTPAQAALVNAAFKVCVCVCVCVYE
jgi:hypothetical protein